MDKGQSIKALIVNDFRIRLSGKDGSIYMELNGGEGAHVSFHPGAGRDAVVVHFRGRKSSTAEVLASFTHAELRDLETAVADKVVDAALNVLREHIVGPIDFKDRKWRKYRAMSMASIPDDTLQSLTDQFAPLGPDFNGRDQARHSDLEQLDQRHSAALVQELRQLSCAPSECRAPVGMLFAPRWSHAVMFMTIDGSIYFVRETAHLMARLQAAVLTILEAHPVGERLVQVLITLPDWIQAKLEVSGASDRE